jgi:aerobic carbon-monoxide dehydrogenase medium subunit
MIPLQFEYVRATSVDDAVSRLTSLGDEARVLSGGQSLIPFMRLRFAAPEALVDISEIAELSYVRAESGRLRVGAMTRHVDLEHDPLVAANLPLLATMAGQIGDTQVRNRGTIGGAVAHADPAGEYAALCLMLDADIVTTRRTIRAEDFFLGRYTTPLDHDELLVEVSFPVQPAGHAYIKFGHKLFDWAIVGVAAQLVDGGARIGLVSMSDTPVRARAAEAALAGGSTVEESASLAADGLSPTASLRASADYKLHLARVLTARAIAQAQAM